MKPHRVSLFCKIDNNGKLLISNKKELNYFTKKWKGEPVIMIAEVNPNNSSLSMRGYYLKKIVPDFQTIFREDLGKRISLNEVDIELRSMCPIMMVEIPKEESGGFELERIRTIYEISAIEMVEFIEHLRIIASRDYYYDIEDPKNF